MEAACKQITPENFVTQFDMVRPPIGFSTKALAADEKSDISNLSEIPGNIALSRKECLKVMKERLVTHRKEILKALFSLVDRGSTNIQKEKLRRVLDAFWIRLNNLQFDKLMKNIQSNGDGSIDLKELLIEVEGKAKLNYNLNLGRRSKFQTYAPETLNTDGIEILLRTKIHSNLKEVVRAFYMHDLNNDGTITKENLKNLLDHFAVPLREDQFHNLTRKYDPQQTGIINYRNFLIKLGINAMHFEKCLPDPSAETAFNWPLPTSFEREEEARRIAFKFNMDDPVLQGSSIDTIIEMYTDKILSKINDVRKGFLTVDVSNSGLVKLQEFRSILNYFVYPTSDAVFRELMSRFPIKKLRGMIAWEYFLDMIKAQALQFSNGERFSIHRWNKDPFNSNWARVKNGEICKCSELTNFEGPLTLPHILDQLRKFNIVPGPVIKKYFTTKTSEGEVIMTRSDFKLLMGRRCCFLDEREVKDLMYLLDPEHSNYITYSRFKTLFCENPPKPSLEEAEELDDETGKMLKSHTQPNEQLKGLPSVPPAVCVAVPQQQAPAFPELSPQDALIKLRRRLHNEWHNVEAAIRARAHAREPCWMMQDELRQILNVLVMYMTDKQWRYLLRILGITTGRIAVVQFLNSFKELEIEAMARWNQKIDSWLGKHTEQEGIPESEIEQNMIAVVKNRGQEFHRDLANLDHRNLGYIIKQKFQKLLTKYLPKLTENQFEKLWSALPVNEYCNLDYIDLLRHYGHYYSYEKPQPRCPCEYNIITEDIDDNGGAGDSHFNTDHEYLTAGGDKDKSGRTSRKGSGIGLKSPSGTQASVPQQGSSTSSGSEVRSYERKPTMDSQVQEVNVPYRPPTPPKYSKSDKFDPSQPFVPDSKTKLLKRKRKTAGLDYINGSPDFCKSCSKQRNRRGIYCNCHYQRGPRIKSATHAGEKICPKVEKLIRPSSLPIQKIKSSEETSQKATQTSSEDLVGLPGFSKAMLQPNALLKDKIKKHWREIRRKCCTVDKDGFGFVTGEEFRTILESCGIPVNTEMENVLNTYNIPSTGDVNYLVFLQQFVIHMQPQPISIFGRRHLPDLPKTMQLGSPSAGLYDTLLSIRAPVLANYINLRRNLRSADKAGRGWIHALEFKKLLIQNKIPLSDENFFSIMEYFDPNLTGHISYNEFLRVFSHSGKL